MTQPPPPSSKLTSPPRAIDDLAPIEDIDALLTAPGAPFELQHELVDGRLAAVYPTQRSSVRDALVAAFETYGPRTHLVYGTTRLTYADTYARARALAAALRTEHGLRKGDRLAILSRNTPHFLLAVVAAYLLGAVVTPINAFLEADALEFCLRDAEARVVLCDVERWGRIRGMVTGSGGAWAGLEAVVVSPWKGDTYLAPAERDWLSLSTPSSSSAVTIADFDALLARAAHYPPSLPTAPLSPDDDAMLMYTSGTTGMPKGVLSAQRHLLGTLAILSLHVARGYLRRGQMPPAPPTSAAEAAAQPPDTHPSVLVLSPLFHIAGYMVALSALLRGAKTAFVPSYSAPRAIAAVKQEQLKIVAGVGFMLKEMFDTARAGELDSLEGVSHGGASSAPELPGDVEKRTPGVFASHGFGSTESCGVILAAVADEYVARPNTIGHPVPGVDVRIVDPSTSRVLPDGEQGELLVRGPCVAKGYWRRPKETAETFLADGFLRTGDLAVREPDGYVYLLDRIKDIIIRGGENVSCASVEGAVYSDRSVLECAAVGLPDPRLGERVGLVVVVAAGSNPVPDAASIRTTARTAGLASFALPEVVWVRTEPLRRNANGKVVKKELRAEVLQWMAKEGRDAKL